MPVNQKSSPLCCLRFLFKIKKVSLVQSSWKRILIFVGGVCMFDSSFILEPLLFMGGG